MLRSLQLDTPWEHDLPVLLLFSRFTKIGHSIPTENCISISTPRSAGPWSSVSAWILKYGVLPCNRQQPGFSSSFVMTLAFSSL